MKRKPVLLSFDGILRDRASSKVAYVILCSCGESYPIRMVLNRTPSRSSTEAFNSSVFNLEKFDSAFTYAMVKEIDMPNSTPLKDLSLFLHDQRMKIEDLVGTDKFSKIDNYVCRKIKKALS